MISNLPQRFPIDKMSELNFGDVEGKNDELLNNPICICKIDGIEEFLLGKKSLVVGERGAGKTALFRLITNGTFKFKQERDERHIILPIDEELQYEIVKDRVYKQFVSHITKEDILYRFVWEVFLLFRMLNRIRELYNGRIPDDLKKAISEYEDIFGKKKKITLSDIFSTQKKTVGFKIDTSPFGSAVPNFYVSMEGNVNTGNCTENVSIIDLDHHKHIVSEFLKSENSTIFILVDKLDEFVIKETYDIQKKLIQGLLNTERSYDNFPNIKLKIFLRSDLFMRLDFDELGFDKVASKRVMLSWSNEDIRAFIARRIGFNYLKVLNLERLAVTIDEEKLYLDKNSIENFYFRETKFRNVKALVKLDNFNRRIVALVKKYILRICHDNRKGKQINFMDEVNRQVITSMFPKILQHSTNKGNLEQVSFFNFIETHFTLATGNTTPRLLVIYLEKCLDGMKSYYRQNPLDTVELDQYNEYPLMKRELLTTAYKDFQNIVLNTFAKTSSIWEKHFNYLRSKRGNKYTFQYTDLKKFTMIDGDEDLNNFLAFLCHIGFLICNNSMIPHNERTYHLPIMFRLSKD